MKDESFNCALSMTGPRHASRPNWVSARCRYPDFSSPSPESSAPHYSTNNPRRSPFRGVMKPKPFSALNHLTVPSAHRRSTRRWSNRIAPGVHSRRVGRCAVMVACRSRAVACTAWVSAGWAVSRMASSRMRSAWSASAAQRADGQRAEDHREMVDRLHSRVRVVHRGGQGLAGHVDELPDAESGVLFLGSFEADADRCVQGMAEYRWVGDGVVRGGGPHPAEGGAGDDVFADPDAEPEVDVVVGSQREQ